MSVQLRRIRLRNIRSYPSATVELAAGTTLITGDVGAGKTSLLYGIEMALFGFAEVDAAYLVRHQAPDGEVALSLSDGDSTVEFARKFRRVPQRGREVMRPIENSFTRDGAKTKYSSTELRQRAIDLLGFPDNPNPQAHSDVWRWAVYVPQEMMREILRQEPAARLEAVRKALGLERYRIAAENAQTVARQVTQLAERHRVQADQLARWEAELPRWAAERERCAADLVATTGELDRLKTQLEQDRARASALASERSQLESGALEAERIRRSIAQLSARLREVHDAQQERQREMGSLQIESARVDEVRRELELAIASERTVETAFEGVRESVRKLTDDRDRLTRIDSEIEGLGRQIASEREAESHARRAVDVARGTVEGLALEAPVVEPSPPVPHSLAEMDREIAKLQGEVDGARERRALLAHDHDELVEIRATRFCPRCRQSVDPGGIGVHVSEATAQLAAVEEALARSVRALEAAVTGRRAREAFERLHDRWVGVEQRRSSARSHLDSAQETMLLAETALQRSEERRRQAEMQRTSLRPVAAIHDTESARLRTLERDLDVARRRTVQVQRAADRGAHAAERVASLETELRRSETELQESQRHLAALDSQLVELGDAAGRLQQVVESARQAEHAVADASARYEQHGRDLGRAEQRLVEADRRLQEANERRAERAALSAERARLEGIAEWLAGPFREALQRLEQTLLARARGRFERLMGRYFSTLIEDPALGSRLDSTFSPEVEIDGSWTPSEALSGGERTALALAYRLALGQVVRSAGQLRLDSLILDEPTDGFSPEQVSRMGELLEELAIPQVVLVSHEGGLAHVADRVIRVVKRRGASVVEEAGGPARTRGEESTVPRRRSGRTLATPPAPGAVS